MTLSEEQLTRAIATPALLGKHVGQRLLGREYVIHPWVAYMEQRILATILAPGRKIIVISVPPQSGKTTYCGMFLPAWYLGHNPSHQIIFVSYNEKQASKWGLRTRTLMKLYGNELFGVSVDPSSDSAVDWMMANGFGGMMSAGITGGITGNPAHLLLIDDVLKGDQDANSPTIKASIVREWDDSVTSRFQEDTKVVMTATRWAEDDLSGVLIERAAQPGYDGTPVEVLNIKAIAEPDPEQLEQMSEEEIEDWRDFLGRRFGEGLKGQHSIQFFHEMRSNNPQRFQAMRQGVPVLRTGGMFPAGMWGYWSVLPEMSQTVRVWDLAASASSTADWTVGTKMGRGPDGRFYVIDRERFRKNAGDVQEEVKRVAKLDGNSVPILIEEERAGAGKTVVAIYKKMLVGYHVEGVRAEGDKTSRATGYSAEQIKGNVLLPASAPWLKEWINEHVQMDGKGRLPKHDDQIDTGAYGFNHLYTDGGSFLWDPSQIGSGRDDLTDEQKMEVLAVRHALGV